MFENFSSRSLRSRLKETNLPDSDNVIVDGDPSVEAVEAVARAITNINKCKQKSVQIEVPGALCGRVVNVVIWEQNSWDFIYSGRMGKNEPLEKNSSKINAGSWVRLRNIVCEHSPFGSKRKSIIALKLLSFSGEII